MLHDMCIELEREWARLLTRIPLHRKAFFIVETTLHGGEEAEISFSCILFGNSEEERSWLHDHETD